MADQTADVVDLSGAPVLAQAHEPAPDYAKAITIIQRWRRILALRWLVLVAWIGCIAMWGYAAMDPAPLRLVCAAAYSAIGFIPTLLLYLKRSD